MKSLAKTLDKGWQRNYNFADLGMRMMKAVEAQSGSMKVSYVVVICEFVHKGCDDA